MRFGPSIFQPGTLPQSNGPTTHTAAVPDETLYYASEGAIHAEASKLTARVLVLGQFLGKQRQ